MARTLKLYNGRLTLKGVRGHGYIAAYSDEDAIRILESATRMRGSRTEIKKYWAKNAWGNQMAGVTPERGLWFIPSSERFNDGITPQRIYKKT